MSIVQDIIASWENEPDRWHWHVIWMKRDDGLEICLQKPYTTDMDFAVLVHKERGRIEFGWWDRRRLRRAFRKWQMRPIDKAQVVEEEWGGPY